MANKFIYVRKGLKTNKEGKTVAVLEKAIKIDSESEKALKNGQREFDLTEGLIAIYDTNTGLFNVVAPRVNIYVNKAKAKYGVFVMGEINIELTQKEWDAVQKGESVEVKTTEVEDAIYKVTFNNDTKEFTCISTFENQLLPWYLESKDVSVIK